MKNKLFNKDIAPISSTLQQQAALKEMVDKLSNDELNSQIEFLQELQRRKIQETSSSTTDSESIKNKELLIKKLKLELLDLKQDSTDKVSELQHKFELDKHQLVSEYEQKIIANKKNHNELNIEISLLRQEISKYKQQLELEIDSKQSEKNSLINGFTETRNQYTQKIKYLKQQVKNLEQEIETTRIECTKQIQCLQQTIGMERTAKINDLAQANRNYESDLRYHENKIDLLKTHLLNKQNELVEHDKKLTRELELKDHQLKKMNEDISNEHEQYKIELEKLTLEHHKLQIELTEQRSIEHKLKIKTLECEKIKSSYYSQIQYLEMLLKSEREKK